MLQAHSTSAHKSCSLQEHTQHAESISTDMSWRWWSVEPTRKIQADAKDMSLCMANTAMLLPTSH